MAFQLNNGCRILIVEDECLIAEIAEAALKQVGCVVVGPAVRLAHALELAKHQDIDIAILDISLRNQPVYPVAEVLARRGIPFIFASGYPRSYLPEAFRDSAVLPKPYRPSQMPAALRVLAAA